MIADHCFIDSYFHQSFCYYTVSNVVVGVHTQYYIVTFVTEICQELAQVSDE